MSYDKYRSSMAGELEEYFDAYQNMPDYGMRVFVYILSGGKQIIDKATLAFRLSERSRLSDSPLMTKKYLFAINASFMSEAAIEFGMDQATAMLLSSIYIRQADLINDIVELAELYRNMLMDYAKQLHCAPPASRTSTVRRAKDFISYRLYKRIRLEDIAENVGVNASYLSRAFKKEMGMTISGYIRSARINEAKNLLRYTDNPCVWIANLLCFSSQSHFTQAFKAVTNITPSEYRASHSSTHDSVHSLDAVVDL